MEEGELNTIAGKVIERAWVRHSPEDSEVGFQVLRIEFTDGHAIEIKSQDYSDYLSRLEVTY